jgi:hypothetical protein
MFLNSRLTNGDPSDGDAKDAHELRSKVIGRMPKPEARGTERREAGREVFGETIPRSKRQSDRPNLQSLEAAARA